ncbi:MAG: accessory gene regulator B family protein [Clostridiales bacterium]|nr:accessory gene regulator B family protein [Clostridiales bacterium]
MLHRISTKITDTFLSNNQEYSKEVYTYGIEIILSSLLGCISVIIISILIGSALEGIIYIAGLSLIRIFAGGYHADTYFKCNIITVSSFCVSLIVHKFCIKTSIINNPIVVIISALFVFTILALYSPVDNDYKPIDENDRSKFKIISIIIAFLIFFIVSFVYYLYGFSQALIGVSAMNIEAISIIISLLMKER